MEGRSNPARYSKPFKGQKIFSKIWQVCYSKLKIFLAVTHRSCSSKALKYISMALNQQKIRSCQFCLQRLVALLFARLSLFEGALKQLKSGREEHILARVLTIENHFEP